MLFFIFFALIPSPALSEEMLDYGAIWKSWGREGQQAYL
jgi:hypothetical protein